MSASDGLTGAGMDFWREGGWELARSDEWHNSKGVNLRRWIGFGLGVTMMWAGAVAQSVVFTRPGTMIVTELRGEAASVLEGRENVLKVDDRLRPEIGFKTGARSALTVEFGNGMLLKLGSSSEVQVPEFWQHPHSQAGQVAEWKEEPSPSRTRLTLVSGDASLTVKPLKIARGSSATVEVSAGVVRITEGVLRMRVQTTEIGIGLCTLELESGRAEFERLGGATAPLPVGRALVLAVETDRRTGAVTVSDAPKPDGAAKE